MYKKTKKTFTLVELIIVIAIIAILAVSAFLVLTKWIAKSRDTKRISDMGIIEAGLQVWVIDKQNFSEPIVKKREFVYTDGGDKKTISYQGKFDEQLKKLLEIGGEIKDPSDGTYYTYSVDVTKTQYSIMAMMEGKDYNISYLNDTVNADYINRYPRLQGHKIGIFMRANDKEPAEDIVGDEKYELSTDSTLMGYMTSDDKIVSDDFVLFRGGGDSTNALIGFYPFLGTSPLMDRSLGAKNDLTGPAGSADGQIGSGWNGATSGDNYIATNFPFTVMLWAKNADGNLIKIGSGSNTFFIGGASSKVFFYASGSTDKVVFSKAQPSSNRIHVAMVVNPSADKVRFYLNGEEIADQVLKEDISIGGDDKIIIGGTATVDEVRIYSRDLDTKDIKNIYNSEK